MNLKERLNNLNDITEAQRRTMSRCIVTRYTVTPITEHAFPMTHNTHRDTCHDHWEVAPHTARDPAEGWAAGI